MIKTFHSRAAVIIVACLSLFVNSCVQEEYKISEETLNLEVTVFQEGVSLPLGSTEPVRIGQLVDQLDPEVKEMFEVADGAYAFNMGEKFDFSEQLAFLSENFSIDAFSINENVPFSLEDVDVSGVNVPETKIPFEQKLSDVIEPVELKIDPIRPEPVKETTDISSYRPSPEVLNLSLGEYSYGGTIATLETVDLNPYKTLLEPYWNTAYPIDEVSGILESVGASGFNYDLNRSFSIPENDPIEVNFNIPLPKGITEVKDVVLHEGAKVKISVGLSDNLFFTSGDIVPHVDLDIHEIFHLTDDWNQAHPDKMDHIDDDFVLNKENHYAVSHEYIIKDMEINYNIREKNEDKSKGDFYMEDGHLVLDKTVAVHPDLRLDFKDLKTSFEELSNHTGNVSVEMALKVEFLDFVVDNVAVVVEPKTHTISTSIDLNITEPLPDLIDGVNTVRFTKDSGLTLTIDAENIDRIDGLDVAIETLDLTFPEGIDIEGAVDNKLSLEIGSVTDAGVNKFVAVRCITFDPATQQPGEVIFNGKVDVKASAKISVKEGMALNTEDLPVLPEDNISMQVAAVAEFDVADFEVDFAGYWYEVNEEKIFEFPVPAEVAEMGAVTIVPEAADGGEPNITIDIVLPETDLAFGPSEEGLILDFPDMIVFKELAPGLVLQAGNVLKLTGELPSSIVLPIDYIVADAELVESTGEYMVTDVLKVYGKVGVAAGKVTKTDVDAITSPDAMVSFNAYIPELVPSTVNIGRYQAEVPEETIGFGDNIDLSTLPEQLVSVGEILLKDVVLDVDVTASGIDDLVKDADVNLMLNITLPDAIMLEDERVNENGVLEIRGKLEGENIEIAPIAIEGLRLNKTAEELSEYMSGLEIRYGGNVTIEDATLDMDALENADLQLNVDVKLATTGSEKIEIAGVTGKIDYQVEPISMDVDLASLLGSLNSENMSTTLDLNRFSLALDLKTNLSVPLLADLSIVPYKDEAVVEDKVLSKRLEITIPEASSEPSLVRFWISNYPQGEDKYMPAGYEHISLDLISLISMSPDKITLELNAGTDPEHIASIAPAEDGYVLEAEYAFNLPLEFGENTHIEFRQVIDGLPEELGTILQYGSLALTGEIESSLPFGLDMTYNFLDSEGNIVEMVEDAGKQLIKPGTAAGEAVKTDLNILVGIKKGAEITDISAIELVFIATSVPGAPIREDSYLKATLQALIPEGVTLDLADFMGKEEEEN